MFWRGTESNYLELDGSSVTNINADAAYAAAQFSDFDPFHARQHILFYNLNDSGDGLLVSDESWLFHAPVALAPAIVQLVGIDQPTEFNYSDISGSLMLN